MGAPQATRADDAQTDAAAQRDRGMGDDDQTGMGPVQTSCAVGRFNHESLVEQSVAAAQGFPITASRFQSDLLRLTASPILQPAGYVLVLQGKGGLSIKVAIAGDASPNLNI